MEAVLRKIIDSTAHGEAVAWLAHYFCFSLLAIYVELVGPTTLD